MNKTSLLLIFILFFSCNLLAAPSTITLEEIVKRSDLIFVGELVRIKYGESPNDTNIVQPNIGYLRIDNVFYDGLTKSELLNKEIPLIMPIEKILVKNLEVGTRGIWILKLIDNKFQITHPGEFQSVQEGDKISKMIKRLKKTKDKYRINKHHKNTRSKKAPIKYKRTKTYNDRTSSFDFFGGLSMPINSYSVGEEIGYNYGLTGVVGVAENFSIGGSFTFNKWTIDTHVSDFEATMRYTELLGVIRYITEVKSNYHTYFQLGGGFFSGTGESSFYGGSFIDTRSDFGVSLSFGIVFNKFLIIPSYKQVFVKDYEHPKWIAISIGITL